MGVKETTKARQKRKQDLVFIHGGKCALCGYSNYIGALHFHHINPEEKRYRLSNGNTHSWEQDVEESKKCLLVCGNCHAEVHGGLIDQKLSTSFSQELYEIKMQEKETKQCLCKTCGEKISNTAIYCLNCLKIQRRKVERPSRQELKDMIRELPFTAIGEKYGITDNAIRKWCDQEKLPRTKKEINSYSDADWKEI